MSLPFLTPDPSSSTGSRPPSSPVSQRRMPSGGQSGPTPFRAPAHKHAHHLHSIPPREKSTRTLIIDHSLWVHARTRFAQARAELGMTDRTGGAQASNYTHRERPENFEEEDEVDSDGEDIFSLVARAGGPGHTHEEDEDERLDMQDLILARNLRQRAESVEKVIASMLDQPPEVPPVHPDDLMDPPTSPELHPANARRQHEHKLPNGVRLRLALATVINDLFARRAPVPPPHVSFHIGPEAPLPGLPSALEPLASVSLLNSSLPSRRPIPNDYIRSLYATGADPDTQNSPPSLRCPRHLHMGCEICVEAAKAVPRPPGPKSRNTNARAGSTASGSSPGDLSSAGNSNNTVFGLGGGVTGWQDGSGIGSGLSRPGRKGTVLRRPSGAYQTSPIGTPDQALTSGVMANTKLAEFIVRFLRLSALVASELGREAIEDRASVDGGSRDEAPPSSSQSHPSSSPLASTRALPSRQPSDTNQTLYTNAFRPSREWYFLLAGLLTRTVLEGYITGRWLGVEPLETLLSVGLGMSSAPASISGAESSGDHSSKKNTGEVDFTFTEFDPDDMPELDDAVKILFPSLRELGNFMNGTAPQMPRREGAELEYELEMTERLSRFYDVPRSTPDVATHMEDLAWQFPAESVERAACRFCEAVAQWRGKPELETYKKASWIAANKENAKATSPTASMSIDSLVHASPQQQPSQTFNMPADEDHPSRRNKKATIDKYFTIPPSAMLQGRKRRRSEVDRAEDARRIAAPMFQ
ncbi:hypothetical protein EIP91_004988 [Steccherinum ochraceum]|uniref:Uncharacterized protein n=1 Tax=Steccherinum ochraceum TaxID=92696 RepID=A0A4V2MVV3_9APHY|nr:hypothetical protein EIP91_004988 [Steccherinum ochraceum]